MSRLPLTLAAAVLLVAPCACGGPAAPHDARVSPPARPTQAAHVSEPLPLPSPLDGDVREPVEITRVHADLARIPESARGFGVCVFEAVIDTRGSVTNIRRVRPIHVTPACAPAVTEHIRALSLSLYRPATFKGQPVPTNLTVTVTHCSSCYDR